MNLVQSIDWLAIGAPTILAVAAVVVLLVDAFLPTRFLPATLTLMAVLAAAVPTWLLWGDPARGTFCTGDALEGPELCSFSTDAFTLVVWGIVLFGTAVVALIGTAAVVDGRTPAGEWHFLLLCSAAGAVTLAASRDLITLLVALEVVSLPAFGLVGLRRGDVRASEAAVKFFLVSVVSTAVTLMGISLLYGVTGSVFLDGIAAGVARGDEPWSVLVVGAVLTVVGLAFKVAAVPFHMWVPDTYVGAPVAVAAYLSVVSKAAGFVGLMLVLGRGLAGLADTWAPVMAVMAALTMTVGNVLALRQKHAVRLLAWSSVAQAGYILVPFGAAADGDLGAAFAGSLGYLAVYAIINLTAFAVAAVVGTRYPAQQLSDYRGLIKEEPGAGWPLAFSLVALAGLPPGVIGLLAKVIVFDAASGVTWLVVVMAINVAIGLVYYAAWLRELFRPAAESGGSAYDVPNGVGVAIGMTFVAGVVFSVLPGWLLDPVMTSLG